jgi:hypothetical protein
MRSAVRIFGSAEVNEVIEEAGSSSRGDGTGGDDGPTFLARPFLAVFCGILDTGIPQTTALTGIWRKIISSEEGGGSYGVLRSWAGKTP